LTATEARVSAIDLGGAPASDEIKKTVAAHLAEAGTPKTLINLLHSQEAGAHPEKVSNDALRQGVDANLTRTLLTCQEVGRAMLEAGRGTIVFVLAGAVDDAVSSVTDTAVLGLLKVLSVEWASQQVRVVAVSPSGPPGPARDAAIAETVAFLASDEASYVTGAVIPVQAATTGVG